MQNAWRFVDDEVLRERLKEAKGIGTPATRAEVIGGLKKQAFLLAQGKNIVPTETGLSLFGVLKQADPSLVDPGLTAQLEGLLDEVVIGKQQMIGAIDAVCDVAQRIIGKLQEGAAIGGSPLLGAAIAGDARSRPPTPAMKQYVANIDAEAVDDPLRVGCIRVARRHRLLDRHRAFDGRDGGGKFQQQAVAHGFEDPSAAACDDRNRRFATPAHRSRRARLVFTHQAGVANDVDRHDCGEFACFALDVLHNRSTSA
jgi:hypothetical protein